MPDLDTPPAAELSTPPKLRLPDFFILGSAKCGTTTLYKYLCRHPHVFMSTPKEMSFFSKDEVYERGIEWYANLFSNAKPHQICGEASTTYTRWPLYENTAERIAAVQPNARLIYLVREPVDRLFSFYAHRMRERVTATFEDFLEATPEAIYSGRYMTQIKQFLQFFSEEQLLVLFTKDLRSAPQQTLEKAGEFLGLSAFDFQKAGRIQANEGGGKYYAAATLTQRIRRLKSSPAIGSAFKLIPAFARKAGYQWLASGPVGKRLRKEHRGRLCTLTPQMRQRIQEIYHDEIEELEAFTGRTLTEWKGSAAASAPHRNGNCQIA